MKYLLSLALYLWLPAVGHAQYLTPQFSVAPADSALFFNNAEELYGRTLRGNWRPAGNAEYAAVLQLDSSGTIVAQQLAIFGGRKAFTEKIEEHCKRFVGLQLNITGQQNLKPYYVLPIVVEEGWGRGLRQLPEEYLKLVKLLSESSEVGLMPIFQVWHYSTGGCGGKKYNGPNDPLPSFPAPEYRKY